MFIHVFGDCLGEKYHLLTEFCSEKRHGILVTALIDQAGRALQHEVRSSRQLPRYQISQFSTIKQLNEKHHASKVKHLGVDSALDCALQLCHYVNYVDKCPEALSKSQQTRFVGDGLGLLCAVMVASSPTPATLIPNAVQAILLAYRLGSYVGSVAERISSANNSHGRTEEWTYSFSDLNEEAAELCLKDFNELNVLSLANKAYVSRVSIDNVEISGPPPILRKMKDQTALPSEPIQRSVFGPYRASHLHSSVELDDILGIKGTKLPHVLRQSRLVSPIISAGETWRSGSNTIHVIKAVTYEYLNRPFIEVTLTHNCISSLVESSAQDCVVKTHGRHEFGKKLTASLASLTNTTIGLSRSYSGREDSTRTASSDNSNENCKLAIVGMAGRFPDADDTDELWELLCNGGEVHRVIPEDRFPIETHVDAEGKAINTSYTPYGCWIKSPGLFDHKFFNMSPREALQTDPMQRLALVTAYEALEMSGYAPNRTPSTNLDRIGTFYGQTSDDWREINAAQEIDTYYITGGIRAFGPGRINYFFKFKGPSLNIDTACSSSAAALQVACTSLLAKECDTAVVGGLSILTNPDLYCGLSRGQFLSKTGPCATFDDAADGYCRADACASLVVKRIEDAIADKDNILAVILGTATNHSADSISITHPHGPTQSSLYSAILDRAGVDPLDVDYIEMHGTGTQAGDSTEMASVLSVFAPDDRKRQPDRPLYLGAVKSSVGHGEAASGVTSVIKVLKMLQQGTIPAHVGIKPGSVINRAFPKDLAAKNVNIILKNTPFRRSDGKLRRMFVNNFSAAGGNTGILLEEAAPQPVPEADPREAHVVSVTGKTKAALVRNAERLAAWMARHSDVPISHVAYTSTSRRIQHDWRIGVVASTLDEAQDTIAKFTQTDKASLVGSSTPLVCLVFAGQGSYHKGMGQELYNHYSGFRQSLREFERIARIHGFPSFISLVSGDDTESGDPPPIAVQLAILCFEMAAAELWLSWGVKPAVVLGHSLGEYAALYASGILSASDTIYLVGERARLVSESCSPDTHAMLAVQTLAGLVMPVLEKFNVEMTCLNSPKEVVLGGLSVEISRAAEQLRADSIACTKLQVPFAFHSSQVDPILDNLERIAQSINFFPPKIPFISSLLGKPVQADEVGPTYIRRHAREPVRFADATLSAQKMAQVDDKMLWLEVGPHAICTNMVKATIGASTIAIPTARRKESIHRVLGHAMSVLHCCGINLDWNEFHRDFSRSTALVNLPSYSFEQKNHWIQYQGDWTLSRKKSSTATAIVPKKTLSTTAVHHVVREVVIAGVAMIDTETNLSRQDIRPSIMGHQCNGVPLCPASLYAEIAIAVSDYAFQRIRPNDGPPGLNVANLSIQKALLFDDQVDSHILHCAVETYATGDRASVTFYTRHGLVRNDHARCIVYYGDVDTWTAEFERTKFLVKARVDALRLEQTTHAVTKFTQTTAYQSFASFVDYAPPYQGMNEVLLHNTTGEATAELIFRDMNEADFFFNPYWIDGCCHLSGFILNAKEAADSCEQVFISEGWESLRFIERLNHRMRYRSYTRMQPIHGVKFVEGDVYILRGDYIIGAVKGVKFRSVSRKALNLLLPPSGARRLAGSQDQSDSKSLLQIDNSKPSMTNNGRDSGTCPGLIRAPVSASWIPAFLRIVQLEIGCEPDELDDGATFTSLGCDSLMVLVIAGRMREELEVDIRPQAFLDHPTIGHFKRFLAGLETAETGNSTASTSSIASIISEGPELDQVSVSTTTTSQVAENDWQEQDESGRILGAMSSKTPNQDTSTDAELPAPALARADSSDAWETACSLEKVPCGEASGSVRPLQSQEKPTDISIRRSEQTASFEESTCHLPHRKATSVLLQGNPRIASKNLFMLPDGSGSAHSYGELGSLGPEWALWGLFSPFMKTPEEYTCGIEGIAQKFIEELKQRQPAGPYALAGWSVGGTIAYEMASQLTRSNELVSHLILIDSPCPLVDDPLPRHLSRWFSEIGVIGLTGEASIRIPDWLLPHFDISAKAFANYKPVPIPREQSPDTVAIWCEDGVCKTKDDPRPHPYPSGHALFLLENRKDFGPNRWDELLAVEKIKTRRMCGNHFTMVRGPLAQDLTGIIRQALKPY